MCGKCCKAIQAYHKYRLSDVRCRETSDTRPYIVNILLLRHLYDKRRLVGDMQGAVPVFLQTVYDMTLA